MGIQGLLPFLEKSSRKCHISEFKGSRVAIDSYCWLHRGAYSCADKLARGENTKAYAFYCLKYIKMLQNYNVIPIMVFDGQHLPAKLLTEKKRREQRTSARKRATELLRLGKVDEARNLFKRCVDITHDMALTLIKECRNLNIDCVVAPYEADAQLTYLNIKNFVDFVITEDSDLILFGCNKILFKLDLQGDCLLIETDKIYISMNMPPDRYSFDKFRYMCILSGCDYLESLPGIGLKKALKFVKLTADPNIYNVLVKLPSYLNMRQLTVTEKYREEFMVADATFQHQLVFDPVERKLKPLTDPNTCGTKLEYCRNAGKMFDEELAFQLALGNVDPFTLQQLDSWSPDNKKKKENLTSIWSKSYKQPKIFNFQVKVKKSPKKMQTFNKPDIIEDKQYDEQFETALTLYATTESLVTKHKTEEVTESTSRPEEALSPVLNRTNPFLRSVKRLSKFNSTKINLDNATTSQFFSSKINDNSPSIQNTVNYSTLVINDENKNEEQSVICEEVCAIDEIKTEKFNFKQFLFKGKNKISNEEKSKRCHAKSENDSDLENLTPIEEILINEPNNLSQQSDSCSAVDCEEKLTKQANLTEFWSGHARPNLNKATFAGWHQNKKKKLNHQPTLFNIVSKMKK